MPSTPKIQDSYPPATEAQIVRFERKFWIKLPRSYRDFLLTTNGGGFAGDICYGPSKNELGVTFFYSLDADLDFLDLAAVRKRSTDVPRKLLTISDDGVGNPICLDLSWWSREKVCLFDHETGRVELVADDFAEFYAGLRYPIDASLVSWTETEEPFVSIEQGDLDQVERIPHEQFERTNAFGQTMLACAAVSRQPEVVQWFLRHGANLHARTQDGHTPLMLAARSGAYDVCKLLLNQGANLEDVDSDGRTPLLNALVSHQVRVAKLLIESGASTEVVDKYGDTPRSFCEEDYTYEKQYILPLLET